MTLTSPDRQISWFSRVLILSACLRPHLLLPAFLSATTGLVYGIAKNPETKIDPGIHEAAGFLGWSMVLCAVHIANLIADKETDNLNCKNLFWMPHLSPGDLAVTGTLLATVGLSIAGWGNPISLFPVGLSLIIGWAYCLPPLKLSNRWGWDALANTVGYGCIAPWLGFLLLFPEQSSVARLNLPTEAIAHLVPLVFSGFLLTTILDMRGDKKTGKETWAVRFQEVKTCFLATVVLVTAGLIARFSFPDQVAFPQHPDIPTVLLVLKPSIAPLIAATFSGLALCLFLAGRTGRGTRKVLVAAIITCVLASGGPALLAFPKLGLVFAGWLSGSYLLLLGAGKISKPSTNRTC